MRPHDERAFTLVPLTTSSPLPSVMSYTFKPSPVRSPPVSPESCCDAAQSTWQCRHACFGTPIAVYSSSGTFLFFSSFLKLHGALQ